MIYSLMTILGIGSALNPILDKCGVLQQSPSENELEDLTNDSQRNDTNSVETKKCKCCHRLKSMLFNMDRKYLMPIFTNQKNFRASNSSAEEALNGSQSSRKDKIK